MKKIITKSFFILTLLSNFIMPQLTTPSVQAVYGGRINAISGYQYSATQTRVFISTESANSIFYGTFTTSGTPAFSSFTVMPGVGNDDGYGSNISKIAAHQSSGYLFFVTSSASLVKTTASTSTVTTVHGSGVNSLLISGNYIFFAEGNNLRFGTIDASGNYTEGSGSPISVGASTANSTIYVNPSNSKVYIAIVNTTSPSIYKSSDNYNALSGSTTFSSLTTTTLNTGTDTWTAFGIGVDGALFVAGYNSSFKRVSYSTNDGSTWTLTTTTLNGVGGTNIGFSGSSSPYKVFFAKGYATYTSGSGFGSWAEFGNAGYETHPNDGQVFVDPVNSSIVYMITDQGIGVSTNGGSNISEIDNGVEAVQVNDFSMNSSKSIAWLASKAGVRRVTDFKTTPSWTNAMFPNGDGSPYYSAEMINDNSYCAYVGNSRIYKTQDAGTNWTQVFTPENAPYSFPSVGTRCEAIEVDPFDSLRIFAAFVVDDGSNDGGLFVSENGGSSWSQILIQAGSNGFDADVYDIAIVKEGVNVVIYVGVDYSTTAKSVYRITKSGSTYTATQDMSASRTAVGYQITCRIYDVHSSLTGDTLLITGTDYGTNHPIAYYKIYSGTDKWTTFTTSGFPMVAGKVGRAITLGYDTVFVAVDNEVYYKTFAGASWTSGYTYPTGTQIQVLFYDALLVGTGTGLYGQNTQGPLPVELTSFTGGIKNNDVVLNWKTATEIQNYGFEIERKIISTQSEPSNNQWVTIGFVTGSGNSNVPKEYSFVDLIQQGEKIYYRLKQIDLDGRFEYSKEVEIEIPAPNNYSLSQNYPNPWNPVTTINYQVPENCFVTLKVFDALGREVTTLVNEEKQQGRYKVEFNGSNLSSGVYLYELKAGDFRSVKRMTLMK